MRRALFVLGISSALVAACSKWSVDTYWSSGGYRLIAVDSRSQMSLIFDKDGGVGLVDATIFSVGANATHIVLKQHPLIDRSAFSFDRSITNYFVVERRRGGISDRKAGVVGPLRQEEFERIASSLSLPAFSMTFDDLK